MKTWIQNPRIHIKVSTEAHIFNSSAPTAIGRWRQETIWKLPDQVAGYMEHSDDQQRGCVSNKGEGKDWHPRLSPDLHMCIFRRMCHIHHTQTITKFNFRCLGRLDSILCTNGMCLCPSLHYTCALKAVTENPGFVYSTKSCLIQHELRETEFNGAERRFLLLRLYFKRSNSFWK